MDVDLSLVPLGDLLTEAIGRMEHAVFVGMQTQIHASDKNCVYRRWHGNTHTCVGLCSDLQAVMLGEMFHRETLVRPEPNEDDDE